MLRAFRSSLLFILLFGLLVAAAPVTVAAPPVSATVSEFDAAASWVVDSGPGNVWTVGTPRTSGTAALKLDYNFTSGAAVGIKTAATPPTLPGLPRALSVDVYGDASWNVVYLEIRDSTGEVFRYWLGNVSFTGWQTMTTQVATGSPVAHTGGDADGVVDLPAAAYQVVFNKNPGGTQTISSVVFDRLMVTYEVGSLTAGPRFFVPTAGGSTTLTMQLAEAGSFTVVLGDENGFARTWSAVANGGGIPTSLGWDGRANGGAVMSGSVSARISLPRGSTYVYDYPYAAGLTDRPAVHGTPSFSGVNSFMNTFDPDHRSGAERLARLMEDAHVRMARESFDWNLIEPRKGYFDWAKFDQAVEMGAAHNVETLGRLEYSASWASSAPPSAPAATRVYYPPANVADFAAYAATTVARYKDRVHFWEIWNEPNLDSYWRPTANAAQYTSLLKAAYAAIKAVDPTATVLLGGLSTGPDQSFLNGIHANGGWSSFDVLAIHTYVAGDPSAPNNIFPLWLDMANQTVAQKGSKPIWITEFGWSTYSGSGSGYIGATEAQQALYIERGYRIAAQKGVTGIVIYELEDYGTNPAVLLENYGAVTRSGRFKPAFDTLVCVGSDLDRAELPVCGAGRQVDRIAGANRYATAAAISANSVNPGVAVAYVATGANFPDALAGAAIAGAQGAPILLVGRDELPAATSAELTRLNPGRIVVLGGTGVVSDAVLVALAS